MVYFRLNSVKHVGAFAGSVTLNDSDSSRRLAKRLGQTRGTGPSRKSALLTTPPKLILPIS